MLFEVLKFGPKSFFAIEATSLILRHKLVADLDYVKCFLHTEFDVPYEDMRNLNGEPTRKLKKMLYLLLKDKILASFREYGLKLVVFQSLSPCKFETIEILGHERNLDSVFLNSNWCFYDKNELKVIITGGEQNDIQSNQVHLVDCVNDTLQKFFPEMIDARSFHGISRFQNSIVVVGGCNRDYRYCEMLRNGQWTALVKLQVVMCESVTTTVAHNALYALEPFNNSRYILCMRNLDSLWEIIPKRFGIEPFQCLISNQEEHNDVLLCDLSYRCSFAGYLSFSCRI